LASAGALPRDVAGGCFRPLRAPLAVVDSPYVRAKQAQLTQFTSIYNYTIEGQADEIAADDTCSLIFRTTTHL
ncbi:hypothetical protein BRADI_4g41505v3, partial [Brachypodium distachyon]